MATNIIGTGYYGRIIECVENLLLDEADETGAGATTPCKVDAANIAWQITVTEAPTAVSVTLQTSADGTTWTTLDTSTTTTEETRHVAANSAKYIRANLGTLTPDGATTPLVTVRAVVKSP